MTIDRIASRVVLDRVTYRTSNGVSCVERVCLD